MKTLNRSEALGLIEGCEADDSAAESLRSLAEHWDVPGYWNADVSAEEWGQALAEIVDEHASPRRDGFPRATDPTDLTCPPEMAGDFEEVTK